jgi:uncharacterized protein YndB with AHSA1/START domain
MERKTKVTAEAGSQNILITREFDLPLALLFKAYTEAELFEQWMGTRVTVFECRPHGSYRFETSDPQGNIVFSANGTIHELTPNKSIIRTFEMEQTPFPVQLEFLAFEPLTDTTSSLSMQIVYRSAAFRDQMMQMPFAYGLNMAHDRLQDIMTNRI